MMNKIEKPRMFAFMRKETQSKNSLTNGRNPTQGQPKTEKNIIIFWQAQINTLKIIVKCNLSWYDRENLSLCVGECVWVYVCLRVSIVSA